MIRAVAYLRVSSTAQRDRQTIDGQRRDVPAYIAAMGWTLAGIYEDDGHSAWTGKLGARLGYARLISDARAGRIDVVVVAAVDRLTRSEDPAERAEIVGRLTRAGVKIAVVGAGIQDPRSLAGDLYLSIMGVLAAAESRIKSERTIAGHITSISRVRRRDQLRHLQRRRGAARPRHRRAPLLRLDDLHDRRRSAARGRRDRRRTRPRDQAVRAARRRSEAARRDPRRPAHHPRRAESSIPARRSLAHRWIGYLDRAGISVRQLPTWPVQYHVDPLDLMRWLSARPAAPHKRPR